MSKNKDETVIMTVNDLCFSKYLKIFLTFVTSDKKQAEFTNVKGLRTVFVGCTVMNKRGNHTKTRSRKELEQALGE